MTTLTTTKTNKQQDKRMHILRLDKADRERLADSLNALLANYEVHYQRLRNYHWNVTGSDFFDIHEQLEVQYTEAQANIDLIAERVRMLQLRPLSTFAEYLEVSAIKESRSVPSTSDMVKELLNDYAILIDRMYHSVETADELSDAGTKNMVMGFIQQIEKHYWMMGSFNK